jgi:hypothetical protein
MINRTETPGQPDLESLMERVREAAGRRRHGGTSAAPPPVSLDGILQRQAELNDALVQAVALLSRQIAELKQTAEPKPAAQVTSVAEPTASPAAPLEVRTPATSAHGQRRVTVIIE